MKHNRLLILGVGCCGLLLYGLTGSPYPYPGSSAALVMAHTGLDPFRPIAHPLWGLLMEMLDTVPLGMMAAKANACSVLCGGLGMVLFFRFLLQARYHEKVLKITAWVPLVTAMAGTVYMALALPSWIMNTRGHYASFHFLFLMLILTYTGFYLRKPGVLRAMGLGLLLGLGVVESADILMAAPLIVLYISPRYLDRLSKAKVFELVGLAGGCGLAFALYVIPASRYLKWPVAEWAELGTVFEVYRTLLISSLNFLKGSIPRTGWLLVFLVTWLPFIGGFLLRLKGPSRKINMLEAVFFIVFLVLCVASLFNAPSAPWSGKWLAYAPPLFTAMMALVFAWTIEFWFIRICMHSSRSRGSGNSPFRAYKGKAIPIVCLVGLAAMGVGAGVVNYERIRSPENKTYYRLASESLRNGPVPDYIITPGFVPIYSIFAAHDLGHAITYLDFVKARDRLYRRRLEAILDTDRQRNLLAVSPAGAMELWLSERSGNPTEIGIQGAPGIWPSVGRVPLAGPGFYFGLEPGHTTFNLTDHVESMDRFWTELNTWVPLVRPEADPAQPAAHPIRIEHSRLANNLGELCRQRKQLDEAAMAYAASLKLWPRNLAGRINRYYHLSGKPVEEASELKQRLKPIPDARLRRVVQSHGSVSPETFNLVWTEFRAGKGTNEIDEATRKAFIDEMKKALALEADKKWKQASDAALALIEKHPKAGLPWVLRGRCAFQLKDDAAFEKCLVEMKKRKTVWPRLLELGGEWSLQKEDVKSAYKAYLSLSRIAPNNLDYLTKVVELEFSMPGLRPQAMARLDRMLALDPNHGPANFFLGLFYIGRENYPEAESAFRRALEKEVTEEGLNNMAHVLMMQEKYDLALNALLESKTMNPDGIYAYLTQAEIYVKMNRLEDARKELDFVREKAPNHPEGLLLEIKYHQAMNDEDAVGTWEETFRKTVPSARKDFYKRLRKVLDQEG